MNILEKCDGLQSRINKLKQIQQSEAEVSALLARLNEALYLQDKATKAYQKAMFLRQNSIPIDTNNVDKDNVLTPLNKILERFSEKPESSSLSKGKDWVKFLENGSKACKTLDDETLRAWKEFLQSLSPGQSPKDLNSSLAKTETNTKALKDYSDLYAQLKDMREHFPEEVEVISAARRIAEQLKRVSEQFDYDVPEDVKEFLAAIAQGGASLNLLTKDVIAWLRENQSEDHYRIVGNR